MKQEATWAIGAWRNRSPLAYAIQTWTRSVYNHVGLVTPENVVIEATWPRVRERMLKPGERVDFFTLDLSDEKWMEVERFMRSQVGVKYDVRGLLRFVTRVPHSENGKWFCSELVFHALQRVGVQLQERIGAEQVPPFGVVMSPLLYRDERRAA